MRGLPARISVVIVRSSDASVRMRDRQLLAGFQDPLVETAARLDADDDQIERVGKPVLDRPLALGDQPAEHEAGNHVADRCHDRRQSPPGCRCAAATGRRPQTAPGAGARRPSRYTAALKLWMPALASRRRSRLMSLGDFGSLLAIDLQARADLFHQPALIDQRGFRRQPPAAASRRRRRSGDVRASSADDAQTGEQADRDEHADRARATVQESWVCIASSVRDVDQLADDQRADDLQRSARRRSSGRRADR